MSRMRIGVMGAAGWMGREVIRAVHANQNCTLVGGTEPPGSIALDQDIGLLAGLGKLNIKITDDPQELVAKVDAIVDFTAPKASAAFAGLAAEARIVHAIGTTGLSEADEAAIAAAARRTTIVAAGNMSLGVNLLVALTRKVAEALDEDFDIEIVEMHHNRKVDAPSGTALMLGAAAAAGRRVTLKERSIRVRDGHTGARRKGDIGFAALRGGNVVGDHTIIFAGEGERIELSHRASDRGIFARGAVKAALWARGKGPGLFGMADVLGL
ncbi:MAG: 4-hydroxy-tetrahydrodipicolinate reductase [Hyphomicrobiaceae bacterium]